MNDTGRVLLVLGTLLIVSIVPLGMARTAERRSPPSPNRSDEIHFNTLIAGGRTYTNVSILPQTNRSIVITHAGGIATVNRDELSGDDAARLAGHVQVSEASGPEGPRASERAEERADGFRVRLRQRDATRGNAVPTTSRQSAEPIDWFPDLLYLGLFHLAYSYCLRRICLKAESRADWMVWIPVLQLVRVQQAAGVSPALLFLWPCCNVAPLYLVAKVYGACGRSPWLGVLLALPSWVACSIRVGGLLPLFAPNALASPELFGGLAFDALLSHRGLVLGIVFLVAPFYALFAYPFLALSKDR